MDLSPAQAVGPLAQYRILSPKAALRVSPLQLGAMSIGEAWTQGMGALPKEKAFELLDTFVAEGGNFIDTANNYQHEQSEKWIGEWMAARGNRDRLVIATKYTTDYRGWELGKNQAPNQVGNHKRSMFVSLRDSLAKLQTDWVDILYLHWWDYTTSIEEVMDALDILVKQGKVLHLGISDSPAWVVAAANTYAIAHGKTPFVVYQGQWNVMLRGFEREILPMAKHFGLALAPWDVLGGGRFKTKKEVEERVQKGEHLRSMLQNGPGTMSPEEEAISAALEKVAEEVGADSITAVALAYVMAKAPYVFPIVGGRKVEHLKDNIKSLTIRLSPEQIKYLESVQPFDLGFPHTITGTQIGDGFFLKSSVYLEHVQPPKPVGY